ncbi:MAG: hypothetical protein IPM66_16280 [Acidobacteriota bacterium]|nr:MAG: hypothetical protein IPM66_16280 [Acidobacteriota bacterium]
MAISRQEFIRLLGAAIAGAPAYFESDLEKRCARYIREYDSQGIHRTGTSPDLRSARWFEAHARGLGAKTRIEHFAFDRVDPRNCYVTAGGRRIDGLPIYDSPFTDGAGISGRLGKFESDAEIGWLELPPGAEYGPNYEPSRRNSRHKAIVILTKGTQPGLCPINAHDFGHTYGPPILQISSEHGDWLRGQKEIRLVSRVDRTRATAWNVVAEVRGANDSLAPLVVMTPRSGWWHSTSERAGGLVCWLEMVRVLASNRPARTVHFLSSSGHELGHLGLRDYIARHSNLVKEARVWIHLGANIGARGATNRLQAFDDDLEKAAEAAMSGAGIVVRDRAPRGVIPFGEAGNIHRLGGRYLSILCPGSPLFHHPEDRWPDAVDVAEVARYATASADLALRLSGV